MFTAMEVKSNHSFTAIVNPAARVGRLGAEVDRIRESFAKAGVDVECVVTERPFHAVEIAREASRLGRTVIAIGGDGTVHEVAQGLIEEPASQAMAVIPLGSGNDFARMIGMAMEPDDAIRQVMGGVVCAVDVGRVEYESTEGSGTAFFVNAAGIGFDGYVATVAPKYKGLPFGLGYLVSILVSLVTWKSGRVVVRDLSDPTIESFDDNMFFMTVGNARDSGGGYTINPKASLVDGRLDVCLVSAVSKLRALQMLPTAQSGEHLGHKEVRYWHSRKIWLSTDIPMPLHTDGEVQSKAVTQLEISVLPGALRVLVPVDRVGQL